jgi:hypothetical protein
MAISVNYSKTSPYATTPTYSFFLDIAEIPSIPYFASDVRYELDAIYKHRPDLLAYDLYGDSGLWWVFSARNPNALQDPVFDFIPGTVIYIPKKETITAALGL